MARGKKSLAEDLDPSDIIFLGEEINPPNGVFEEDEDSGYGFTGLYGDYALVIKKVAYRTGKKEDGENAGKVIKYYKWTEVNYHNTLLGVVESYVKHRNLSKIKRLKKVKDFSEIEKIYKDTNKKVDAFLKNFDLTVQQTKTLKLYDELQKAKNDLNQIDDVLKEAEKLHELIKEKRKIIISNTEPKKHRLKLEND